MLTRTQNINYLVEKNKKYVDEFNDNMKKTIKEYEKTPAALVNQLVENSIEKVADTIDDIVTMKKQENSLEFQIQREKTPQENIEFTKIQAGNWRLEALREADPEKEQLYKSLERVAKLKADNIRLKNNERLIHEEAKESDLRRLKRFKKWAKENLLGISAVAISIADIITTIIVSARKVIKQGANVAKKVGPLIAPILNLIAQMLIWGAKGIEFLSKNLWLLAMALAYFVYDQYNQRKKK